jgi:hypothetical protein
LKHEGKLFKIYFKARGYGEQSIADALKVSRTTINNWMLREKLPEERREEIEKLLGVQFDQVTDPVKVLTGSNKVKKVVQQAAHEYQLAKPVPYFDIDVSASNIEMFTDERELPTKAISIDGFEDCDFGVPVFGDSMYPTFVSGTIILCKKITDFDVIQYGEPHLIITKEQRFVKRILKGPEKGTITLASDNTDARDREGKRRYENFDISKNKIRHLFIVKGSVKRSQL